jgi:hypothetical protein
MYVCMYKGWATKPALAPRPLKIYCNLQVSNVHKIFIINVYFCKYILTQLILHFQLTGCCCCWHFLYDLIAFYILSLLDEVYDFQGSRVLDYAPVDYNIM